jgi:hypothetical protein
MYMERWHVRLAPLAQIRDTMGTTRQLGAGANWVSSPETIVAEPSGFPDVYLVALNAMLHLPLSPFIQPRYSSSQISDG